ncbi:MAG: hydantoinase/oxoprolinase family protein [Burkholderiaceae bacterium]
MPDPVTRVGIDASGSHINLCLFDRVTGESFTHKAPAQPESPTAGIRQGLQALLQSSGVPASQVSELVHSTTLPLDLLQSCNGSKLGLLVTKGFESTFDFAVSTKNGTTGGTAALTDSATTRGIAERVSANGNTLLPFDDEQAREAANELLSAGVESIAICLLHAYANPAHERRTRDIIRTLNESIPVVISSDVAAESGEQSRALATVVNASVYAGTKQYLSEMAAELREIQLAAPISVMQSSGSLFSVAEAVDMPVSMMTGANAASASGAACIAASAGYPEALALDMGSAAAKISLIRQGSPRLSNQTLLWPSATGAGEPLSMAVPSIDVRICNTGSGSMATSPAAGAVALSPGSGEHIPRRVGTGSTSRSPTVIDAQLVLGRLQTTGMQQKISAAEGAVSRLATSLDTDRHRAAQGIIDIANEQLAGPLRRTALEKGLDPAELALLACGGAGPMHGCAISLLTGCSPVIVPLAGGALSAFGLTQANRARQFAQTVSRPLGESAEIPAIIASLDHLTQQADAWSTDDQHRRSSVSGQPTNIQYRAELRYQRSNFTMSALVEPASLKDLAGHAQIMVKLSQAYQRRFGNTPNEKAVELVSLRAIASAAAAGTELKRFDLRDADPGTALVTHEQVYFNGGFTRTAFYSREKLFAGNRIHGPAIVTQADTTTVIEPGFFADVDAYLNLLIRQDDTQMGERQ